MRVLSPATLSLVAATILGLSMPLFSPSVAQAQALGELKKGTFPPNTSTPITIKDRRFRFEVGKDWIVQESQGIYVVNSQDNKFLMIMALLDKPEEVPVAMAEMDKMVLVTGAQFGKATHSVQNMIPMQTLPGAGTLQPAGVPVELLSVTLNVIEKPVVVMFYVHKDAFKTHLKSVTGVLNSFSLLLEKEEVEALQRELKKKGKLPK